jgi:hypothetical protein
MKFVRHWVVEQAPFTQAKLPLQVSVSVQPEASEAQAWTAPPLGLQRRAPGLHMPAQTPSRQMLGQALPISFHAPVLSHSWRMSPAHCLVPGRQLPPHSPLPVQTLGQGWAAGSQVPIGLQFSTTWLTPQRLMPGGQEPPQEPLEQRFGHGVPATQAPFSLQVSGVRPLGPEQRFVPGLQSPVQAPWPEHTFGQGIGSAIHSPTGLHVSGVWLEPQCLSAGLHMPEQAPPVHVEAQVSLTTHSPSTVQTSTAAPVAAQRVAAAVHAGASDGASMTLDPPVPGVPPGAPLPPVPDAPPTPPVPNAPPDGASDDDRASVRAGSVPGSYLFGSAQAAPRTAVDSTKTMRQVGCSLKALLQILGFRQGCAEVAWSRTLVEGSRSDQEILTQTDCPDFGQVTVGGSGLSKLDWGGDRVDLCRISSVTPGIHQLNPEVGEGGAVPGGQRRAPEVHDPVRRSRTFNSSSSFLMAMLVIAPINDGVLIIAQRLQRLPQGPLRRNPSCRRPGAGVASAADAASVSLIRQ